MIGPYYERDVFHGHDHDERPEHERQDAEQVSLLDGPIAARDEQAFLQRVERARADVAKHDPERAEREPPQSGAM